MLTRLCSFYTGLRSARGELESKSLETDSTADAVALVILVQDLKKKIPSWETQMKVSMSRPPPAARWNPYAAM
jgi:hypothetical protein